MATSVSTIYSDQKATDFYLSAMFGGKTLSTAGITIDNDVPYKYIVRGLDLSDAVQSGQTCVWADGGSTSITEGVKEVQPFFINKTECYKDYKEMKGAKADGLPDGVQAKLSQKMSDIIKAKIETDLWKASITGSTGSKAFDGYVELLKQGGAIEVSGVTLSASNIVAQLNRVYDAMPEAIKAQDNGKKVIFVSFKAEGFLKQALSAQGVNTSDKDYAANHLGIEVRGVGIADNKIAAGLRESFHFASNVGLDDATVNIKDMYPVLLERNARLEAEYKYVPAVSNANQIVLYGN